MQRILGLVPILSCFGVAAAQQEPEKPDAAIARVRAIHASAADTRMRAEKEVEALRLRLRTMTSENPDYAKLSEQLTAATRVMKAPQGSFFDAFREVDWSKFDPTTDQDLLDAGLSGVSADLRHPEKSIAASRMLLQRSPNHRLAPAIRLRRLPLALLALDQGEECVAELRAAAAASRDQLQAQAFLTLGDVLGVMSDFEGAKKAYGDASATGQKEIVALATRRAEVVGMAVPAPEGPQWIGGEPMTASALAGKVRMLVFFATHAPPARAAAAWASTVHDAHTAKGLATIVVTRPFGHGYLPGNENQLDVGGTARQGMNPGEFLDHLRQYHTNTKLHCPILVSDEALFAKYGAKQLPTLVLVGRDDKVALVTSIFEDTPLLEFGIRRHLAAK